MAKFLSTKQTASSIEDIIRNSEEKIVLVSPFLAPSPVDLGLLKQADSRGVKIKILYGKNEEIKPDLRNELDKLENLEIFYQKSLHSKCYFNENTMVITSLNYLEFSERTNWEMGVLINIEEDGDIYQAAVQDVETIEMSSELKKTIKYAKESEPTSEEQDNLRMEYEFEDYVHNILCSQKQFEIETWNTDYHKNIRSSKYPDFVITYKPKKERFAIECKYLKNFHFHDKINQDVMKWTTQEQIDCYCDYSIKEGIPITIVIGLGGKPNEPESMYCIPLKKVEKYPNIYPSIYTGCKRAKVDKKFYYKKEDGFVE